MTARVALALRSLAGVGAVATGAIACHTLAVNPSTAGFVLLLVVLFASAFGGLWVGICASLAAAAAFPFFLPPVGSVHVAETENWVALAAFLIVAVVSSRLVTRAREQADRAEAHARQLEAVRVFAVELLGPERELPALARGAADTLLALGARGAGVFLQRREGVDLLEWRGDPPPPSILELGRRLGGRLEELGVEGHPERDFLMPVVVGGESVGTLACLGSRASADAVESVGRLLTLALERERLAREQLEIEVLRGSEAFKTALLRAVSHDLTTPLTAIGFHIGALRRSWAALPGAESARETLDELEADALRLQRRIQDLLALGRLEAGTMAPRPEPVPPADLFRAAREHLPLLRRPVAVRVDADCPDAFADPSLALEIVVNLLENADRASADGAAIELEARRSDGGVRIGVLDRGHGVACVGEGQVIDAGDVLPRGLGLEIARQFAAASGGSVVLESRSGGGVAAWVELPGAPLAAVS